jgi:hypothetical protein
MSDNGSATISGSLVAGDLTVTGTSQFNNTITIGQGPDTTISGSGIDTDYIGTGLFTAATGTVATELSVSGTPVMINVPSTIAIDTLSVSTLATVSGIPVMATVPANVVIESLITDNLTVNEFTSSLTITGTLTVSGASSFCDDADFKGNVVISGSLSVGQVIESIFPEAKTCFTETISTTSSTSYVDAGCETEALQAGDNLVLFRANTGATAAASTNLRCLFAGSTIGEAQGGTSSSAAGTNEHWTGSDLAGFKVVTGDGVNTAKIQHDLDTGSSTTQTSSMAVIGIPLGVLDLTEDTDYFFENGSDSETNVVTTFQTITTMTVTLPETGNYLFLGYIEGKGDANTYQCRFQVDAANVHGVSSLRRGAAPNDFHCFSIARVLNLTAGSHTFRVQAGRSPSLSSQWKRGRLFVVKASSFEQLIETRTTTDATSTSSTFAELANVSVTYNPVQKQQLVVIANPIYSVDSDTDVIPTFKLRNDTDATDHGEDAGGPTVTTTYETPTYVLATLEDTQTSTDWKLFFRDAEGIGSTARFEEGNIILWSMAPPAPTFSGIESTEIVGSGIVTPNVEADCIEVNQKLTISGNPVATGTSGGGVGVTSVNNITGDITLTGAGTISITDSGQNITISGATDGTATCYVHTQGTAATTWTIVHNLNTETVNYIVLDSSGSEVEPDSFTVDSKDQVTIVFASAQDGIANIFPCGLVTIGTATGAEIEHAFVGLSSDQTSNLSFGDHVEFTAISGTAGISLSLGSGQDNGIVTLPANKTFFMQAHIGTDFSGNTGDVAYSWHNNT